MGKVTLINPARSKKWRLPPLGLLYVASYLEKNGVDVRVIDPLSQGNENYALDSSYAGITCMSSQFERAREIAKSIKTKSPGTITVVGGVHPTVAAEEACSDPNIDVAIVGEGEKAFLKVVKERIKKGVIIGEPVETLDKLPIPARHLVNMNWYLRRGGIVFPEWIRATSVITSRGCPNSCHFCINSKHAMFGRRVRYQSAEYVENEVEELYSKYRTEGIFFVDDNFVQNRKRLVGICKRIKKFNLKWTCLSRVDTINKQVLEVMRESGCVTVGFGVESGSQKVLDCLNKNVKVEKVAKAFDLCHNVGVKTWATIIIGSPKERKQDIELTDRLLQRIKPDYLEIFYLTPYKGTILYDKAIEEGWVIKENANWLNNEPQVAINFTLEELAEIRRDLLNKYNPKWRWLRSNLKNPYFIYDAITRIITEPSYAFKRFNQS
jgi:anaerobic magnesium-protoporphyrin IX monomethyl ester cyclase